MSRLDCFKWDLRRDCSDYRNAYVMNMPSICMCIDVLTANSSYLLENLEKTIALIIKASKRVWKYCIQVNIYHSQLQIWRITMLLLMELHDFTWEATKAANRPSLHRACVSGPSCGESAVTVGIPLQSASNEEIVSMSWRHFYFTRVHQGSITLNHHCH